MSRARELADLSNVINKGANLQPNLIINSDMSVAQRGTSSTSDGFKTVDRFRNNIAGCSVTQSQESLTTGSPYNEGFRKFYRQTNTSTSSATSAMVQVFQPIEAQNLAKTNWNYVSSSSYITLSFWAKSSLAGTYNVELRTLNGTGQLYATQFTLAANTWTKITKSISGNSGITINNDNSAGLYASFIVHYGTDFTDSGFTYDSWGAFSGGSRSSDFAQNWSNTASATFDLTGVSLVVGDSAPVTHPYESSDENIARCQRYYWNYLTIDNQYQTMGNGSLYNSLNAYINFDFPVQMRAEPTLGAAASNIRFYSNAGSAASVSVAGDYGSVNNKRVHLALNAHLTSGHAGFGFSEDTLDRLYFDAEL